jgi:hypothetical protein
MSPTKAAAAIHSVPKTRPAWPAPPVLVRHRHRVTRNRAVTNSGRPVRRSAPLAPRVTVDRVACALRDQDLDARVRRRSHLALGARCSWRSPDSVGRSVSTIGREQRRANHHTPARRTSTGCSADSGVCPIAVGHGIAFPALGECRPTSRTDTSPQSARRGRRGHGISDLVRLGDWRSTRSQHSPLCQRGAPSVRPYSTRTVP